MKLLNVYLYTSNYILKKNNQIYSLFTIFIIISKIRIFKIQNTHFLLLLGIQLIRGRNLFDLFAKFLKMRIMKKRRLLIHIAKTPLKTTISLINLPLQLLRLLILL